MHISFEFGSLIGLQNVVNVHKLLILDHTAKY